MILHQYLKNMTPFMALRNSASRKKQRVSAGDGKRGTVAECNARIVTLEKSNLKQSVVLASLEAKYEVANKTLLNNEKATAAIIAEFNEFKQQQLIKKKSTRMVLVMRKLRSALGRYQVTPQGIYTVPSGSLLTDVNIQEEIQKLLAQILVCVTM
jgi:hypothetical protein